MVFIQGSALLCHCSSLFFAFENAALKKKILIEVPLELYYLSLLMCLLASLLRKIF